MFSTESLFEVHLPAELRSPLNLVPSTQECVKRKIDTKLEYKRKKTYNVS